jgi:hypothetical protein
MQDLLGESLFSLLREAPDPGYDALKDLAAFRFPRERFFVGDRLFVLAEGG